MSKRLIFIPIMLRSRVRRAMLRSQRKSCLKLRSSGLKSKSLKESSMGRSSQEKRMSKCKMPEIRAVINRQLAKLIKR